MKKYTYVHLLSFLFLNLPIICLLACREDNKDSEKVKALTEALNSKEVKSFIEEKYDGSIVPTF